MTNKNIYFIDDNGTIWSVNENGQSKFPQNISVSDGKVLVLGENDGFPGREILAEYTAWTSLTELAVAIEYPSKEESGHSLSLAIGEHIRNALSFERAYRAENKQSPSNYPLVLTKDNAGLWDEMLAEHDSDNSLSE